MVLAIKTEFIIIIAILVGCIIISALLYYVRKYRHNTILRQINENNYETTFLKLEKMLKHPFPAMLSLEKETIYLEMAILQLLSEDYDKFNFYIDKINDQKLHFVKTVWKSLYFFQIENREDFEKNKSFADGIYSKFSEKFMNSYKTYIELLNILDKDTINKEHLQQIEAKITSPFGRLIKAYISKIND